LFLQLTVAMTLVDQARWSRRLDFYQGGDCREWWKSTGRMEKKRKRQRKL